MPSSPQPEHMLFSPVCCDHFGLASMRDQIAGLRADNQLLRDIATNLRSMNRRTIVYAKTPVEQEIVDLVTKAADPIDQLKDKLGIK